MSLHDAADESYGGDYPENVFDWMRALYVALAHGQIKGPVAALAGFLALSGDGSSGENCYLDEDRFMAEFGIHRATLYRRLKVLRDAGWIEQTRLPAYTGEGSLRPERLGRKAQFRVAWPRLDVRHDLPVESSRTTPPDDAIRQDSESCRITPLGRETQQAVDNPSRVAIPEVSCRTTTPDGDPLPTCDLPTLTSGHPSALPTDRARAAG